MEIQVYVTKQINYVEEAIHLLYNYVNHNSYEKMKEKGLSYIKNSKELYEKRYQHIVKISNYVYDNLRLDKSRLEYYFKEIGNTKISIANYILPISLNNQYPTLDEYITEAKSLSSVDLIRDFNDKIAQYDSIGKSGDEEKVETFEDIINVLDQSDILIEDRWKIIQVFLNRDKYLEEIEIILRKTIELLNECQNEIHILEAEFYNYWSNYIETNDFLKKMQEYSNFTWKYSDAGTLVVPYVFQPQMMSFSINDSEEKKVDVIHIGIMLDSNFAQEAKDVDCEKLYNVLKLMSDKSKFEILMHIKEKPAYGFELANVLNLSTSTISYHMTALISERLVKIEKDANKVYYSLNKTRINDILEDIRMLLLK